MLFFSLNGGGAVAEGGVSAREKKCEHRGGRFGARGGYRSGRRIGAAIS